MRHATDWEGLLSIGTVCSILIGRASIWEVVTDFSIRLWLDTSRREDARFIPRVVLSSLDRYSYLNWRVIFHALSELGNDLPPWAYAGCVGGPYLIEVVKIESHADWWTSWYSWRLRSFRLLLLSCYKPLKRRFPLASILRWGLLHKIHRWATDKLETLIFTLYRSWYLCLGCFAGLRRELRNENVRLQHFLHHRFTNRVEVLLVFLLFLDLDWGCYSRGWWTHLLDNLLVRHYAV